MVAAELHRVNPSAAALEAEVVFDKFLSVHLSLAMEQTEGVVTDCLQPIVALRPSLADGLRVMPDANAVFKILLEVWADAMGDARGDIGESRDSDDDMDDDENSSEDMDDSGDFDEDDEF